MKKFAVQFLQTTLTILAHLAALRFRPRIVGVTGSVGKTSAKLAVASVLGTRESVRASPGNFNNDLGLPLALVGGWSDEALALVSRDYPAGQNRLKKARLWLAVLAQGVGNLLPFRRVAYPQTLVLEYGADRPGDIKRLLGIARPSVAVVTAVGKVPVHVEYYAGPEEVAREKARLIEQLPTAGFAVLNADDESVVVLKDRTRARVVTYGFSKDANVRITRYEIKVEGRTPRGISFKLEYGGSFVPVVLSGAFGRAQALSAAAGAAVGLISGLNLVTISEGLSRHKPAPSRMSVAEGVRGSIVMDDSYNASPLSMHSALETLQDMPAKRKVAVLGDMLEIGEYAMSAHQAVGRQAAEVCDVLVVAGERAKFIAESAVAAGMSEKDVAVFDDAEAAGNFVREAVRPGDAILVKASHAMGFSDIATSLRVVHAGEPGEPIMPDAEEVLPREEGV